MVTRKDFISTSVALAAVGLASEPVSGSAGLPMYGIIGRIHAIEGKRDELASILVEGASGMPGCLSYVVAKDPGDPDSLWVTEVWDSRESHAASLSLPSVQAAMSAGRPLIASFSDRFETEPIGGHGLG